MWLKKCTCFLLACVAVFGCLFTPVAAAELEEQKVEIEERRASGKFDFDIPAKTLMKASSSFPMEYGETVTITASYTPASASMDFGLIDSDGTFYPVRANNGSINQTIRIDLRGNYTAYRIWVQNDTNQEMKVTVTYTGMPAGMSRVFRVQAGKSRSMEVNKARAGVQYYADFQTDDGSFEGICSVRISDTPFN